MGNLHRLSLGVNLGPLPVAHDGSLAAKGSIISNPCQAGEILAHTSDGHQVGHELGYDPMIAASQHADIRCVAVNPCKYVCHLSRAAGGGETF